MGREIVYCGDCGRRLNEDEFDRGRAHFVENRPFCTDCRAPAFVPKKKHSTTHIPLPPQTPRRAMQIAGGEPARKPSSRAPLAIGLSLGAVALVAIVALATGGGRNVPPAPKESPKAAVADDLLPLIQDLEKFAASGAEPEAVLTRCDRERTRLRGSKHQERFMKVETAAKDKKASRDQASQFEFAIADIRKVIASDADFLRRDETLDRLKKAREFAGPRLTEVDRILADYAASFEKRQRAPKPVALTAPEATRKGKNLHLKGDYLGNWKTAQDWAEWTFDAAAGTYRVEILLACAKDSGGEFLVLAGAGPLKGGVSTTGDWKTYQTVQAGTLVLPQGRVTLSVKAASVKGGGLMNLRSVTLTPLP